VFLDTNVLASGFGTRGLCADVVREVLAKHELLTCRQVLDELDRALTEKFEVPAAEVAAIHELLSMSCVTQTPGQASFGLRDAADEQIVAAAVASAADVLVTGDKDILTVRAKLPLPVADPREFWRMLKAP
jgi:putative PIN family toxin of toxin-antitoxin system